MDLINTGTVIIERYTWDVLDANCYVIREGNEILIIDPIDSEEYMDSVGDVENIKITVFLTHEHYDHIGGLNRLRENYECTVLSSKECSERIQSSKKNLSSIADTVNAFYNHTPQKHEVEPFSCAEADVTFENEYKFDWRGHQIYCKQLLGHSHGSVCYIMNGEVLFSGDEILPIPTVTRLPGGDTNDFWRIDMPWLESMAGKIKITFPGHGDAGDLRQMIDGNEMPEKMKID